ncbi:MAG: class I SAM-dependent methyltransferase [Nanoarchaeota archaeon]
MKKTIINNFVFKEKPSFAKLWDICLYNLMYDAPKYVIEIEKMLKEIKLNKDSNYIDLSAGTGFLSLELAQKGYSFDFMDAMDDEIEEFNSKASKMKVKAHCKKLTWLKIPGNFPDNHYDMAFCRGNSFIFAAGGWNEPNKVDPVRNKEIYEKTLKIFYNLLKKGGYLYIDKFKDDELPGKSLVGKIVVNKNVSDLLFYTEIKKEEGYRKSSMLLRDTNGKEEGLPNMTYLLSLSELEDMLKKVGFSEIKQVKLKSEEHFVVLLAKK